MVIVLPILTKTLARFLASVKKIAVLELLMLGVLVNPVLLLVLLVMELQQMTA